MVSGQVSIDDSFVPQSLWLAGLWRMGKEVLDLLLLSSALAATQACQLDNFLPPQSLLLAGLWRVGKEVLDLLLQSSALAATQASLVFLCGPRHSGMSKC